LLAYAISYHLFLARFPNALFLFLSKLLPLFIYPLGLSCLLLGVTLVLFWKHPRWAAVAIALALTGLLLGSNSYVAAGLVRSLERQHVPGKNIPKAEAIVVLGGATRAPDSPRPWVEVNEAGDRVLYAARLYQKQKAPRLILSGGRINWKGTGNSESEDMASLLQMMGVPSSAILEDPSSLNTYENAVNVKQILDREGIKTVLLVTSAMHMPRSMSIFKKLGIEASPAPTDFLIADRSLASQSWQDVVLDILPDAEQLYLSSRALKEYIGLLIYRLKGWA
jgi:uncharacterized SAM-binding protein YcdF (DUF218 family)